MCYKFILGGEQMEQQTQTIETEKIMTEAEEEQRIFLTPHSHLRISERVGRTGLKAFKNAEKALQKGVPRNKISYGGLRLWIDHRHYVHFQESPHHLYFLYCGHVYIYAPEEKEGKTNFVLVTCLDVPQSLLREAGHIERRYFERKKRAARKTKSKSKK
jgi:hypothetical protein